MTAAERSTSWLPRSHTVTSGRLTFYFGIRYATPLLVLLAIAATSVTVEADRLTGVLTTQLAFTIFTHAMALRRPNLVSVALFAGMLGDVLGISALVVLTGGAGGPLAFLYTLHALAAGILLSSRAGLRVLMLSTAGIVAVDVIARTTQLGATPFPRGLEAVAALWVLGGAATLFSTYNERELRRQNAELATVRQISLDIEDSLSLEQIFSDLCRGVRQGFGFDGAAVLLREDDRMRCVAAEGITGSTDARLELRGRLAEALDAGVPLVTGGEQARRDGALIPLLGAHGYLAVPLSDDGLLIVTRSGRRGKPGTLRAREIDTMDRLAHHARLAIANARLHEQVHAMAVTDPLTGVANHGEMQRRLTEEVGRLKRYATLRGESHRLSVVLLDIDHFKRFNDRFGHQAGDEVLRTVARQLQEAVRSFDFVARYGGEEFAVLLPETPAESAREVAERIRAAVSASPYVPSTGKPVRITVSIGIATGPENATSPAELIKLADTALYRSKADGRNRVTHIDDTARAVAKVVPLKRRKAAEQAPPPRPARNGR